MKKGFTLIEVVAVIIVLGIMALITFPIVSSNIKEGKERAYNNQVSLFIDGAKKWSVKHTEMFSDDDGSGIIVSIADLIKDGYIANPKSGHIKNPINGTDMEGCIRIKYTATYQQYTYEYIDEC